MTPARRIAALLVLAVPVLLAGCTSTPEPPHFFAEGKPAIWMLGWDAVSPYPVDAKVSATTLRHGNFDYLTGTVKWDPAIAKRTLPDSLYLRAKPAFFEAGRGYRWPWVDPAGPVRLHTLPAKARYDAGTPFVQP